MPLFASSEPLLRPKQTALDVQDLKGIWSVHWQIGFLQLWHSHYTRIDQIFLFWAFASSFMFTVAQFTSLSWSLQAWLWSLVSLATGLLMTRWTWCWTGIERLRWLIWLWLIVLVVGIGLTDYSIFGHWGWMMGHLCALWLLLCAIGYVITGVGLESRSLCLIGLIHGIGIGLLPILPDYQFFATGLIMASTLLFLGEYQWDMRPPTVFANLTESQRQFNERQQQRRVLEASAQ